MNIMPDYQKKYDELNEKLATLGSAIPGPMSGFSRLHKKAIENGALDSKTKELMALAIAIVIHCEGCILYHTRDAITAGASREEFLETIGVAIMMGGGPAAIYSPQVIEIIDQLLEKNELAS